MSHPHQREQSAMPPGWSRRRMVPLTLFCAVVASLAVVDASGGTQYVAGQSASRAGALVPLPGTSGCLRPVGVSGCDHARGIDEANDSAVSPDGRNVYVVSGFGAGAADKAIATFARDSTSGELRQLAGPAGCVSYKGRSGCAAGRGGQDDEAFLFLESVDVSPDGRNVYVVGLFALLVFARDPDSGALTQLSESDGCLSGDPRTGCERVRAMRGSVVRVSPNGRNVYVVSWPDAGAVAVFARDGVTGALRQMPGRAGCVSNKLATCEHARGTSNARDIALSPDGRSAYIASYLTRAGGAGSVLRRDTQTGALHPVRGAAGCITWRQTERCRRARGIRDTSTVAVSPDGRNVYFAGAGVATFARNAVSGRVSQPSGRAACLVPRREPRCRTASLPSEAANVTVSPSGRNVYLSDALGSSISVLRRSGAGVLSRLPGASGCLAPTRRPNCSSAPLGVDLGRLTVSPDGRHAYVTAGSGGLTLFSRQP